MTDAKNKLWWIATALQLIGVFALASHAVDPVICYWTMLSGSCFGSAASAKDRNLALFLLNTGYTLANVVGIVRWS